MESSPSDTVALEDQISPEQKAGDAVDFLKEDPFWKESVNKKVVTLVPRLLYKWTVH